MSDVHAAAERKIAKQLIDDCVADVVDRFSGHTRARMSTRHEDAVRACIAAHVHGAFAALHPADDGEAIRTMEMKPTERGFAAIYCENYPKFEQARLVQESSAIREYDDAMEKPGSSCLWIGDDFHLNREQVRELVGVLQHWLRNKTLRNY